MAAETVGTWRPEPGYTWVQPELKRLQAVRWTAGVAHPVAPNVLAAEREGGWYAAEGYEWVDAAATSLAVRRRFTVATAAPAGGVDWSGALVGAFEKMGADMGGIARSAKSYSSPRTWRWASNADVAAAGAGACAIPVAGAAALPVEFLYLMRQMYNSALGMGFIMSGSATAADFPNIMAVWAEEFALDDQSLKVAFDIAERVAAEAGEQIADALVDSAVENAMKRLSAKSGTGQPLPVPMAPTSVRASGPVISSALAQKSGAKVGSKLGTKVTAKAGAKIGAKYAAKGISITVPVISAVVCAGANGAIMNDFLDAAELYFRRLSEYRAKRYGRAVGAM